ncbi:MAG: hypothetical protein V2A74_06975 [bacterium]
MNKRDVQKFFLYFGVPIGMAAALAVTLQQAVSRGVLERLAIRNAVAELGDNPRYGANWLIDLHGFTGSLPIFVSFTSPMGLQYFVSLEKDQPIPNLPGQLWRNLGESPNASRFGYTWLGPFPPKTMTRTIIAFYMLSGRPYRVHVGTEFDSENPPASQEEILREIESLLLNLEAKLK